LRYLSERIMAQSRNEPGLVIEALVRISDAKGPLQADELCQALEVEIGSKDFNAGNVPSISGLVSWRQGLITVDRGISTVLLIHFTLKDHLLARPDVFARSHSTIEEICLT